MYKKLDYNLQSTHAFTKEQYQNDTTLLSYMAVGSLFQNVNEWDITMDVTWSLAIAKIN